MDDFPKYVLNNRIYDKIIDGKCNCLNSHCINYRYVLTFDVYEFKFVRLQICNEVIKNMANNILFERKDDFLNTNDIDAIFRKIYIRNGIIYGSRDKTRLNREYMVYYYVSRRPAINAEIKISDFIQILYHQDHYTGWYSDIMDDFRFSLTCHLNYLLGYKKANHQHETARKILKHLKQHKDLSKDQLYDLATLIFNLKINKHESTSKQ